MSKNAIRTMPVLRTGEPNCKNWVGRKCTAGYFNGSPSPRTCQDACTAREPIVESDPAVYWTPITEPLKTSQNQKFSFDGSKIWAEWYGRAIAYTGDDKAEIQWISGMKRNLPIFGCACRAHASDMFSESPPDLTNRESYFASVAKYHNMVNERLKKDQWSLSDAKKRWNFSDE